MDRVARYLSIQYGVTDALARSATLGEAADRVLHAVGTALGWQGAGLWLVDDGSELLRCAAFWTPTGAGDDLARASLDMTLPPGIGIPGRVWSRNEPLWIADLAADTAFSRGEPALRSGMRSAFAVPLRALDRVLGVLEVFRTDVTEPDRELLQLFEAIGAQLGLAVTRIRAQEAVAASEARFRGVVDAAHDAVIVMDADGRVVEWNIRAEELFGWPRKEVVGRSLVGTIVPERYRERHRGGLARYLADRHGPFLGRLVEVEAMDRSGREFPIELAITAIDVHGAPIFGAFLRDISERKRDEDRMRLLAEVGTVLGGSLDLETTLGRVAHTALAALADYCLIHLIEEDGTLRRVAIAARDPEFERRFRDAGAAEVLTAGSDHPAFVARDTGRAVLFGQIGEAELRRLARSEHHLAFLRTLELRQWLCLPLVARGVTLGVIGMGLSRADRRWDRADLDLAEELARRGALAVENARLYRQARDAVRARDEFLAAVSHDLRNPLASIKGLAQLLARRARRAGTDQLLAFVESLERIDNAATRMTHLLDELVEVSGMRIGQPLQLAREPVDLVALARDLVQTATDPERVDVVAPEPSLVVAADAGRIQRVLSNLLANAVKYSAGRGRIVVRVARADGAAEISVRDEGVGIPAEDLPYIFERFRRGSNVVGKVSGTGIGLTAAKQIVELHGGTIAAESVEGEGSTFKVRLPLDPSGSRGR